jgi:hypothetical protein
MQGRILALAFDGPHTAERLVTALPEEVEQGSNPPQGVADRKVQAHVQTQHVSFLLSARDDGSVHAGPCCFWQLR